MSSSDIKSDPELPGTDIYSNTSFGDYCVSVQVRTTYRVMGSTHDEVRLISVGVVAECHHDY